MRNVSKWDRPATPSLSANFDKIFTVCAEKKRGAGLLIAILVILTLGLLAGTVAVNIRLLFDEDATTQTQAKLRQIGLAISSTNISPAPKNQRHYEQDVGALPSSLTDLMTKPGAVAACSLNASQQMSGWCGPYVIGTYSGEASFTDGWGSAIILDTSNRKVYSAGPNRTDNSGASDDIVQNF